MDYRSSMPGEGESTVLYGHNMKNGSMFGSLKRYWDNEYREEHPSFCLYTADGDIFLCRIQEIRKISAQTDFFAETQSWQEGIRVILITCVAGKQEERLMVEADAELLDMKEEN